MTVPNTKLNVTDITSSGIYSKALETVASRRMEDKFVGQKDVPFTTEELIDDLTMKINLKFETKIGVMFTIEWALYLKHIGQDDVTLVVTKDCQLSKKICAYFKINYIVYKKGMPLKFDVVVGNPPYKKEGEKGGARSAWRSFVKIAFELANAKGIVALVCPGFPVHSNDLGALFTENTPLYLNNDASSYFTVGSKIKTWIVQKGKVEADFIVDDEVYTGTEDPTLDTTRRSILAKTNVDTFECKQDGGFYSSTQFKNDPNDYFATPTGNSIYPIRHASKVKVAYVSEPTPCHTLRKVMMTFSGHPGFEYYDETTPMSSCYQMSGYIVVNNAVEGQHLIDLYNTKLYKFLAKGTVSAGMRGVANYTLPKLDITRSWSNEEVYAHFGLTTEEISYVENNI